MKLLPLYYWILAGLILLITLPAKSGAQPAKIQFHREIYFVNSGLHDGPVGPEAETIRAYRDVILIPGARWLRLQFQAYDLGITDYLPTDKTDSTNVRSDSTRSCIIITSLEDGATQRLDAISLKQWRNTSAYFNGDAVELELYVAPDDKGIFFEIEEVMVGELFGEYAEVLRKTGEIESVCGGTDDRVASNDLAVGRLTRVTAAGDSIAWCTGWIAANGAYLTAGHCFGVGDLRVLEFSVPESDSLGTPRFAHPDNQYALITNPDSIKLEDAGVGDDWAVFTVYPNSSTELLPVHAQGAFYRVSRDHNPNNIRITGYGVDGSAPCFGSGYQYGCNTWNPPRDSTSQTQQTHADTCRGESGSGTSVYWRYDADTQGGNSGSPIIVEGTDISVGIHTHGSGVRVQCPNDESNRGTSFESNDLEDSLNTFPGANIEYADKDHPVALEDGTVFRPYDTVQEAVTAVSSGGIVSIVKGYYNETMTISKAMTIEAPVGVVTIGASGLGKLLAETPAAAASSKPDTAHSLLPTVYSLSPGYPNPFNPVTTIRFGLPEAARTRLVVYDLLGREIVRLVDGHLEAAYHAAVWNGKDAAGRAVPSGIYIARLWTPAYTKSIKMVLLK